MDEVACELLFRFGRVLTEDIGEKTLYIEHTGQTETQKQTTKGHVWGIRTMQ